MACVSFVTGRIDSGKTTRMERFCQQVRPGSFGGVLARKRWVEGRPAGYDLVLVPGDECHPLARMRAASDHPDQREPNGQEEEGTFAFGPFLFRHEAFRMAASHLERLAADPEIRTLLIDEVGPMELGGGGHAPVVHRLLGTGKHLVLCVRTECLEAVRGAFRCES